MKGTLILHGGGTTGADTTRTFLQRVGGVSAPVIVLGQSSEDPVGKGKRSADWLKENGATNTFACEVARPDDPAMGDLLKRLETAKGVWMPGGDQNRFQTVFGKSGLSDALKALLERGGVVGGTSAGASLIGEWMPTGDGDRTKLIQASVQTAPGLNLLKNTLFDTHLLARERVQRLVNMVLSRPSLLGVGIDENAWIEIDRGRATLTVREGQAVIIRTASPVRTDRDQRLTAPDVRLSVLGPGDSATLKELGWR